MHEAFVFVARNDISGLWEIRVDGHKKIEFETFSVAEKWAHEWCDRNEHRVPFLSIDRRSV